MEKTKTWCIFILSAGLFSLALSLAYFTFEIARTREALPEILDKAGAASENIKPVIREIANLEKSIPNILDEVSRVRKTTDSVVKEMEAYRKLAPGTLEEVKKVREEVPAILKQVEQTRTMINKDLPPVLEEVKKTRETIPGILAEVREARITLDRVGREADSIRKEVPRILVSMDKASKAVEDMSAEVGKVRPLVPGILEEIKTTREELPGIIDQADKLAMNARQLGQEAGKGAVGGAISGVLTSPFDIVGAMGKSLTGWLGLDKVKGLTDEDKQIAKQKTVELLEKDKQGVALAWANKNTGHSGTVQIVSRARTKDGDCRNLLYTNQVNNKKTEYRTTICRQKDGSWDRP